MEQTQLADGRLVQLGGEVVGPFHTAYTGLCDELGLDARALVSQPARGGHLGAGRRASRWAPRTPGCATRTGRATSGRSGSSRASPERWIPTIPGRIPRRSGWTACRWAQWLRETGATPNVVRARDLFMLALSAESVERTSLLADLRKEAAAGAHGFYSYDVWECLRVEEGSATVALRMAEELGHRVRYGTPVARVRVDAGGCPVTAATGERFETDAVVCALPVAPLRRVAVEGVSEARMASLDRQRNALAAKAVLRLRALVLGGTGPERRRVLRDRGAGGHLDPAGGHRLGAGPARAPGGLPHHLTGADRGRAGGGDGAGLRPAGPRPPGRLPAPLGRSTPGPRATSPAGGRAT